MRISNMGEAASAASFSTRIKTYPDGSMDVLVCDRAIFREAGWERSGWERKADRIRDSSEPEDEAEEVSASPSERAMRRARAQVRELALANDFGLFVTLTLNGEVVDRYDMAAITKKLNVWLDNQVRRRGLAYVLVPERHKDGAIHFHGLFNDALEVVDSGTLTMPGWERPKRPRSAAQRAEWIAAGASIVHNLPRWTLGFTTAIRLYGDREQAIGYVTKYIGKQGEKPGGRWYYSGGALRRPEVTYCDMSVRDAMEQPGAYSFTIPGAGATFCQFRIRGGCE